MGGFTIQAVYYVESQNPGFNPIAIRPKIKEDQVEWEDTGHGRAVSYSKLFFDDKAVVPFLEAPVIAPQRIKVVSKEGKTIELTKLTLDIFKSKVPAAKKENLNFKTDDDVQKYYLTTDFYGSF